MSYIKGELDELEREEFFRLKKVQAKKKKDAKERDEQEDLVREGVERRRRGGAGEIGNLIDFANEKDEDLLFRERYLFRLYIRSIFLCKTFRDKRTCIQVCNASTVQHCLLFIPIFLINAILLTTL